MIKESIGQRICRLRKEADLSQQELAEKARVSATSIWSSETERTLPRIDTAIQIARVFGVSLDYLACQTDERSTIQSLIENQTSH